MTEDFARVGVAGAGMMGSEIALVCALAGRDVRLADKGQDQLDRAMKALDGVLARGVERGLYRAEDRAAIDRIRPTTSLDEFGDRDLVIEAVFEDAAVKAEALGRIDRALGPDAVITTNTSTISIAVLAATVAPARRPRFLGTHFFSPVSRMKLVEVIPAFDTDDAVVDRVQAFAQAIGKTPVRVKDVVGFAVNRLLHAFFIEAVRLVEEGVISPEDCDVACRLGLGHPVGPFELMDAVTNGLTLQAQEIMHQAYGARFLPRPLLKQMVASGRGGRKAGRGWYRYEGGKRR
jgi:3-hydroxybutyryl-CoA dehydrogenase